MDTIPAEEVETTLLNLSIIFTRNEVAHQYPIVVGKNEKPLKIKFAL